MRVITGEYKGRKLISPVGTQIRPTSDRIKEAIFSHIGSKIYDSIFIDLFCGSGAIGIEALSRGAKFVYFVDSSKESLRLTNDNIQLCGVEKDRYQTICQSIHGSFQLHMKNKPDILFMDPPYQTDIKPIIRQIGKQDWAPSLHKIIIETDKQQDSPDQIFAMQLIEKRYGSTKVMIYY